MSPPNGSHIIGLFKDSHKNILVLNIAPRALSYRVKSRKFGRSAKFGQRHCLFHILIIRMKNKLTKQTVSRLIGIFTVCNTIQYNTIQIALFFTQVIT